MWTEKQDLRFYFAKKISLICAVSGTGVTESFPRACKSGMNGVKPAGISSRHLYGTHIAAAVRQ